MGAARRSRGGEPRQTARRALQESRLRSLVDRLLSADGLQASRLRAHGAACESVDSAGRLNVAEDHFYVGLAGAGGDAGRVGLHDVDDDRNALAALSIRRRRGAGRAGRGVAADVVEDRRLAARPVLHVLVEPVSSDDGLARDLELAT